MATILNFPNLYHSRQTVSLNGARFVIELHWNRIAQSWSMDILDGDENPVITSAGISSNRWITKNYLNLQGLIGGAFLCRITPRTDSGELIGEFNRLVGQQSTGNSSAVQRDSFFGANPTHQIMYVPENEYFLVDDLI